MTYDRTAPTEAEVRTALAEIYRPEGIDIWMRSRNPLLKGDVPSDLVARGEGSRVLDLIAALAEGVIM